MKSMNFGGHRYTWDQRASADKPTWHVFIGLVNLQEHLFVRHIDEDAGTSVFRLIPSYPTRLSRKQREEAPIPSVSAIEVTGLWVHPKHQGHSAPIGVFLRSMTIEALAPYATPDIGNTYCSECKIASTCHLSGPPLSLVSLCQLCSVSSEKLRKKSTDTLQQISDSIRNIMDRPAATHNYQFDWDYLKSLSPVPAWTTEEADYAQAARISCAKARDILTNLSPAWTNTFGTNPCLDIDNAKTSGWGTVDKLASLEPGSNNIWDQHADPVVVAVTQKPVTGLHPAWSQAFGRAVRVSLKDTLMTPPLLDRRGETPQIQYGEKPCNCDTRALMLSGCKCGGV